MADVLLLFASAVAVLLTTTFLVLYTAKRRALARKQRAALRQRMPDLETYLRGIDQATTEEELDRLEQERKTQDWDGLSLRSLSGSWLSPAAWLPSSGAMMLPGVPELRSASSG